MAFLELDDVTLHYLDEGDPEGAPLVFAHALGTGTFLWDAVVPLLPAGLRIIRYDARGHGQSSTPPAPYAMGALIRDAERLMDHLQVKEAMFVGLSIGGMVAQGLAVKRPDLIRALVLSNTGAKIGTPKLWAERIAMARRAGGASAGSRAAISRKTSTCRGSSGSASTTRRAMPVVPPRFPARISTRPPRACVFRRWALLAPRMARPRRILCARQWT